MLSGTIALRVPLDVIKAKCALYRQHGKPWHGPGSRTWTTSRARLTGPYDYGYVVGNCPRDIQKVTASTSAVEVVGTLEAAVRAEHILASDQEIYVAATASNIDNSNPILRPDLPKMIKELSGTTSHTSDWTLPTKHGGRSWKLEVPTRTGIVGVARGWLRLRLLLLLVAAGAAARRTRMRLRKKASLPIPDGTRRSDTRHYSGLRFLFLSVASSRKYPPS